MLLKKLIKDYFTISKRDRLGIVALLVLIFIIYLLPRLFSKNHNALAIRESDFIRQAIDTLETRKKEPYSKEESHSADELFEPKQGQRLNQAELFEFDPNLLSAEGWQKLGLSEKTSKTIDKYRSKGGRFHQPEDLQKIWGLPPGFYERVKGYVRIANPNQPAGAEKTFPEKKFEKTERKPLKINVNEADTITFALLPGIGNKLASRIVNFREKLGGFYSVEQIAETYGLPDSTFQKIKANLFVTDGTVRKLNVNSSTKEELKNHPYLKWALANAIVEYRTRHGVFTSLEDLKKIALVSDSTFKKIFPYVEL